MAAPEELVVLGVLTRPHGIGGELRAHIHNPDSTLIYERDAVLLRRGAEVREVAIASARRGPKGAAILRLDGVEGRDAAEALRGAELCVRRDELPPAGEDEWYVVDLIGLDARDSEGRKVGEVVDVIPYPTVDCLRVRSDDGVREVPITDDWVLSVDVAAGRIVVASLAELPAEPER